MGLELKFFKSANPETPLDKELDGPELKVVDMATLEKDSYFNKRAEDEVFEQGLGDAENDRCLQTIQEVIEDLPQPVRRLFAYKTQGIYFLRDQYKNWSALTLQSVTEKNKSIIAINAKAVTLREARVVLYHELGHTLDYEFYSPHSTPQWAWKCIDEYSEILRKEPDPIEGSDRDKESHFGATQEEWASRLGAAIATIYGDAESAQVTSLRQKPLLAKDFRSRYPKSFRFFEKYLDQVMKEIDRSGSLLLT